MFWSTSNVEIVTALPTVVPSNPRTWDPLLNPTVPIPMLNEPWILSTLILLNEVTNPTDKTAPLPALAFPVPNVPIPRVSPTA